AASSPTFGPTTTRGSRSGCLSKIACSVSAPSVPVGGTARRPSSIHGMPGAAAAGGPAAVVECVPNVSEGRDRARIDALASAIRAVPGVTLANVHADPDHHRSVITFLGTPDAVEGAALALAARVVTLVDMRHHRGVHPRVGALDVLPFTPLVGVTLEQTVALAPRVGRAIGERPAVQAMGVRLASRGIAQVAMNLLDYRRTSIPLAFDRVVDEARRRHARVSRSELVGLAPRAAFAGRAPESVGLETFTPELCLDTYLAAPRAPGASRLGSARAASEPRASRPERAPPG